MAIDISVKRVKVWNDKENPCNAVWKKEIMVNKSAKIKFVGKSAKIWQERQLVVRSQAVQIFFLKQPILPFPLKIGNLKTEE